MLRSFGYTVEDIDYIYNRIIRVFWSLVADDIQDGFTDWPVDTGFSKANFYQCGRQLCNHASYAKYVEGRGRYVTRYVRRQMSELVDRSLRFAGVRLPEQRPAREREERSSILRVSALGLLNFRRVIGGRRDGSNR